MTRQLMKLLWLPLFLVPARALAQATATTTATTADGIQSAEDVMGVIKLMAQAFESGGWALGAGLLLALLVAAARFFKALDVIRVPDAADKWVAMGIAMATSVAVGLQTGQTWLNIVGTAVSVGVTAIGGWEMLLRPFRDKVLKRAKFGEK